MLASKFACLLAALCIVFVLPTFLMVGDLYRRYMSKEKDYENK